MVKNSLEEAAERLVQASSIVVTSHVQPDGDALGSLLAMFRYLNSKGKTVCPTWGEEIRIPAHYTWLPGINEVVPLDKCIQADVLLALDCANARRLGALEERLSSFKTVINIDHHIDNSSFGTINVLDFSASATCELVYDLMKVMNTGIDKDTANLLYAGIVTDTGRFQYSNTTAKTLRTAADLIDHGAQPNFIFQKIYENLPYSTLKLLGKILDRSIFIEESSLIYSYLCDSDFRDANASMTDTESFIDFLRMTREAHVAAILKETPDNKLKVSLRSKGVVDVGSITREHGGGGHRNAAGVTFDVPVEDAINWISERVRAQLQATASS